MDNAQKERYIKLLKNADFDNCDKNQIMTIINLFDSLQVPMREDNDLGACCKPDHYNCDYYEE